MKSVQTLYHTVCTDASSQPQTTGLGWLCRAAIGFTARWYPGDIPAWNAVSRAGYYLPRRRAFAARLATVLLEGPW